MVDPSPAPRTHAPIRWHDHERPLDRQRPHNPIAVLLGAAAGILIALAMLTVFTVRVLPAGSAQAAQKGAPAVAPAASRAAKWRTSRESAQNPLYTTEALSEVECRPPELAVDSAASWEEFAAELDTCLTHVWRPDLQRIGVAPAEAGYDIVAEPPSNMSGSIDEDVSVLAYYEAPRQRITVVLESVRRMRQAVSTANRGGIWVALIAHEYGHFIQDRTGIMAHAYGLEQRAGSEAERLELLRRSELQAECFSGATMAALSGYTEDDLSRINQVFNGNSGDLDTHGTAENRMHWFAAGMRADDMAACNTFTAPDELVA